MLLIPTQLWQPSSLQDCLQDVTPKAEGKKITWGEKTDTCPMHQLIFKKIEEQIHSQPVKRVCICLREGMCFRSFLRATESNSWNIAWSQDSSESGHLCWSWPALSLTAPKLWEATHILSNTWSRNKEGCTNYILLPKSFFQVNELGWGGDSVSKDLSLIPSIHVNQNQALQRVYDSCTE